MALSDIIPPGGTDSRTLLHLQNAIIDIVEQLGKLFGRHGRECEANQARKHDRTGAVVLDELFAELFCVNALRLDAHKVTAVARHRFKGVLVFRMGGKNFLDDVVALLEHSVLFLLLLLVFGALECGEQDLLADARGVGNVTTDGTGGLVFESLELCFGSTLEAEAHEAHAEAP